jgi:putative ABC transport system permease protein
MWVQLFQRMEFEGARTQMMTQFGADARYMEIQGGQLLRGRFFTTAEENAGTPVVVLEVKPAEKLFGRIDPLGRFVRVAGKSLKVIGVYQNPENIFQVPSQEIGAILPFETARRSFRYDETNALWIVVKPREGVPVTAAMDAVTVQMRRIRGLRPAEKNSFDLITQDQILDIFNQLTGVFFLVMLALSSVALMVGGIGVMAIMMVSVTERTREIGVRKALGATRREIMWQFLVEASTLTLAGGLIGVLVGLGAGEVLKALLGTGSGVPLWSAVVACLVSVVIGLVFGVMPATRAARLDPVEALRYGETNTECGMIANCSWDCEFHGGRDAIDPHCNPHSSHSHSARTRLVSQTVTSSPSRRTETTWSSPAAARSPRWRAPGIASGSST